eukprot:scaffold676_cov316-Pavlova_lutheri.AAC.35
MAMVAGEASFGEAKGRAKVVEGNVEKDFEMGATLGKGMAGKVVVGTPKRRRKEQKDHSYAIKLFDTRNWTEADRKSFFRECLLLSKSKHPNIVELVAIYRNMPGKYGTAAVMELCTGGELFDRLQKSGTLSEEEARMVALKTLSALKHMHSLGIAHRDVKPENLVYESWEKDAELKLIDFGFAKSRHKLQPAGQNLRGETDMFRTRLGSPNYVAPEVLSSGTKGYTEKCDIWSLGVTLYIMLCGYFPFYHRIEKIMYQQIVTGDYSLEDPEWDCISSGAKRLVKRMLTVDPQKRPSAEECLCDPWVCQSDIMKDQALPPSTFARFSEFNRTRKSKFVQAVRAVIAARKLLHQRENQRQPFSVVLGVNGGVKPARLSVADVALLLMARNKRRRPSRLLCLLPEVHVLPELTCLDHKEDDQSSAGKENEPVSLVNQHWKACDVPAHQGSHFRAVCSSQKSFSWQLSEIMHGESTAKRFTDAGKGMQVETSNHPRASQGTQGKLKKKGRLKVFFKKVMGWNNDGGKRLGSTGGSQADSEKSA